MIYVYTKLYLFFIEPSSHDLSYPIIQHDFANESTTTLHELDTTAPYQNTDFLHELFQAREALEDTNHNKSFIKDRGKRMYRSAENSPVLSRSRMSATRKNKLPNIDFRERTDSITPRLALPNIDKVGFFEVMTFSKQLMESE